MPVCPPASPINPSPRPPRPSSPTHALDPAPPPWQRRDDIPWIHICLKCAVHILPSAWLPAIATISAPWHQHTHTWIVAVTSSTCTSARDKGLGHIRGNGRSKPTTRGLRRRLHAHAVVCARRFTPWHITTPYNALQCAATQRAATRCTALPCIALHFGERIPPYWGRAGIIVCEP